MMVTRYINYPKYDATLLIDDVDLDLVINKKNGGWRGRYTKNGWSITNGVLLHRSVMERAIGRKLTKDELVDHRDRNNCNNTRDNLRLATKGENNRNRTAIGTSKYLGVVWSKDRRKWVVSMKINGKSLHLGLFDDEIEAALAYNRACQLHYPGCEFSALNDVKLGYSNNNRPLESTTKEITKEEYEAKIYEKENAALEAEAAVTPGDYIQLTLPGIEQWL